MAVRDRDLKLLAWLEYAETLVEGMFSPFLCLHAVDESVVHRAQQLSRSANAIETEPPPEETVSERRETSLPARGGSGAGLDEREREMERRRAMDPWRNWASKWEAWAGGWAAGSDLCVVPLFPLAQSG